MLAQDSEKVKSALKMFRARNLKPKATKMVCLECDKKFSKVFGKETWDAKCPRCGSFDTDTLNFA